MPCKDTWNEHRAQMSQQTMTMNGYFRPGLFRFLKDLKTHNERAWFQANKQRYEADVREPFLRLIADLAPTLKKIGGGFAADPSPNGGSMMRIYRDIRFSKDKSPYKTYAAAHFWHAKGKAGAAPGYYLHLEPGNSVIGGGIWQPEPKALKKIRDKIAGDPKGFPGLNNQKRQNSISGAIIQPLIPLASGIQLGVSDAGYEAGTAFLASRDENQMTR